MSRTLVIGIPSKGRLQENANAFFTRAGLPVTKAGGARTYTGTIRGFDDIEIAFLSASEISKHLAEGKIHAGITGEDLLRENIPEAYSRVELVAPLGFGYANVVVAVPRGWIDVATMADLDDVSASIFAGQARRMRVATKYTNLTRAFFDRHGLADYRIVESLGATEGAPSAGSAEIIVDITSTGSTLAANSLKILDDGIILKSQANLAVSLNANWTSQTKATLKQILDRVAADANAQNLREVRFTRNGPVPETVLAEKFGCTAPFGQSESAGDVILHCPQHQLYALIAWLRREGVGTISVARLEYVFEADNALYSRIANRLGW